MKPQMYFKKTNKQHSFVVAFPIQHFVNSGVARLASLKLHNALVQVSLPVTSANFRRIVWAGTTTIFACSSFLKFGKWCIEQLICVLECFFLNLTTGSIVSFAYTRTACLTSLVLHYAFVGVGLSVTSAYGRFSNRTAFATWLNGHSLIRLQLLQNQTKIICHIIDIFCKTTQLIVIK